VDLAPATAATLRATGLSVECVRTEETSRANVSTVGEPIGASRAQVRRAWQRDHDRATRSLSRDLGRIGQPRAFALYSKLPQHERLAVLGLLRALATGDQVGGRRELLQRLAWFDGGDGRFCTAAIAEILRDLLSLSPGSGDRCYWLMLFTSVLARVEPLEHHQSRSAERTEPVTARLRLVDVTRGTSPINGPNTHAKTCIPRNRTRGRAA
jgi:hypothetical protein